MHKRENGFVSIIVASILMVLLTLIVLGLSRLMQREQRQSLDRQLSTQAFYAAETAVNDVQNRLQTGSLVAEEKTTCDVADWPTPGANGVINSTEPEVKYTCLIYDSTPSSLEFNNGSIKTNQSRIFPVQAKNGVPIDSIQFEWSGSGGVNTLTNSNCASNPFGVANTESVPVLRVDLIRLPSTGNIDRQALIDQTVTTYLYPQNGCGINDNNIASYIGYTAPVGSPSRPTNNGQIVNVQCGVSGNYSCRFNFTNINSGFPSSDRYFVRLKSVYNDADVRVTATSTAVGVDFEFVGAQTVVDSTGKAKDVLRRMKVNLSNSSGYPIPEYVFQSMDGVCKLLNVAPGNIVSDFCFP